MPDARAVERARQWALDNPERHREHQHRSRIKACYGLTLEEYDASLARGCAICGSHGEPIAGKRNRLGVDHDHTTGKVRDALCNSCNAGLGHFGHNPARLRAAAKYLLEHVELN